MWLRDNVLIPYHHHRGKTLMHPYLTRFLGILILLFLMSADLVAQEQPAPAGSRPTRVPVLIALVDSIPETNAQFVVRRGSGPRRRDVILLRSGASEQDLSNAVRVLLVARRIGGDSVSRSATVRVRPRQEQRERREFPWVGRVWTDLQVAQRTDVPGVGRVRAVQIWLPRQARRGQHHPNVLPQR